jgi:hypothetical protein
VRHTCPFLYSTASLSRQNYTKSKSYGSVFRRDPPPMV